jgi:hypothetical protein
MATRWIDGTALAKHDVNAETLQHIARYVVHVAGEPLTVDEEEAAIARLQEMLYWNTHEALGEAAARRLKSWLHANTDFAADSRPRYGDGRMAPHEWIRTHDPALVKVDSVGHDVDHTVVGPQTWMWDAAGTISEWNLSEEDGALFLRQLASEGLFAPVSTLPFYRMAYAAFRLGQCTLCAQMSTHDSQEQQRLWGAVTLYTTQLSSLLEHATS